MHRPIVSLAAAALCATTLLSSSGTIVAEGAPTVWQGLQEELGQYVVSYGQERLVEDLSDRQQADSRVAEDSVRRVGFVDGVPHGRRLIRISEHLPPHWLTEEEINELRVRRRFFVDVTDWEGPSSSLHKSRPPKAFAEIPKSLSQQAAVQPLLQEVSPPDMRVFLEEFSTSFRTRYYKSGSGAEASSWLYKQILDIVDEGARSLDNPSNITVTTFQHKWQQRSIIARFHPSPVELPEDMDVTKKSSAYSEFLRAALEDEQEDVVIIGAHLDSINLWIPSFGRAPGADDDGSGTTTILEAFRILVESGFRPRRPVEFHWYSAEEAGLLGSADIARSYAKDEKRVLGMMQFDMTGYHKPGTREVVGLMTDHVDPNLTDFLRLLIDEYSGLPYSETSCGYGCSDHASWTTAGYASAVPFESEFKDMSPYVHSTEDTVETLSFDHMAAFVRIALGYAVELGNLDSSE